MGKGDNRTKRGKMFRGTKGKTHLGKKPPTPVKPEPKPAAKAPRVPREQRDQTAPPAASPAEAPAEA